MQKKQKTCGLSVLTKIIKISETFFNKKIRKKYVKNDPDEESIYASNYKAKKTILVPKINLE